MAPGGIAGLGPVMQLAYVQRDPANAIRHWTEVIGAGPFFAIESLRFHRTMFRGRPSDVTITVMLGYWGDMQIELITPLDDAPSVYTEWLAAGRSGIHHLGIVVDDQEVAWRRIAEAGLAITQESSNAAGRPVFYVETHEPSATMFETMTADAAMQAFFAHMREAHRTWDGCDPVRPAGLG